MIFLIDYENIREEGLRGIEFLEEQDQVEIFFSKASPSIKAGEWNTIVQSGCKINCYQLDRQGNNALDFCIAVRIGVLVGGNEEQNIAIVSKDKGFQAIFTYCVNSFNKKIVLAQTIRNAICTSAEASKRKTKIIQQNQKLMIKNEFEQLMEYRNMYAKCAAIFSELGLEDGKLREIVELLLDKRTTARELYLFSLKNFGRKAGIEAYHRVKELTS